MGSSCFARGNALNLKTIEEYIAKNHLDAEVELGGIRCGGQCSEGPNIAIDDVIYHEVDQGTLLDILEKHFKGGNK